MNFLNKKCRTKWETQTGMCRWSISTFGNSCQGIPWTYQSEGKWLSRETGGQSNPRKRSATWKVLNVEKLETLPVGTKPRTPHPWQPTGERRGKRKHSMMITERMRESSHTNVATILTPAVGTFKFGEMVGYSECIALYIILNWTERNWRSGRN